MSWIGGHGRTFAGTWFTAAIAILIGTMLWQSLALSPVAGWIPRIVLTLTLGMTLAQWVIERRDAGRAVARIVDESGAERSRRALAGVAWVGGLLVLTLLFGAVAGSMMFCLAWLRLHARETWSFSLSFSVLLGLALWVSFGFLPGVRHYAGFVGSLLA